MLSYGVYLHSVSELLCVYSLLLSTCFRALNRLQAQYYSSYLIISRWVWPAVSTDVHLLSNRGPASAVYFIRINFNMKD